MTVEERVQELITSKTFAKSMFEAQTPDDLMQVFLAYQIELDGVSKEDAFASVQRAKDGELLDNELDNVSGGVIPWWTFYAVNLVPGGALVVGAVAVGALAYGAYRYYKKNR